MISEFISNFFKKYFTQIICLIFLGGFFSGCWPFRIGVENLGRVLTQEPERIRNKIKNPVRDEIKFAALWAGHSSTLIQIEDKVFLFDPVFNDVIAGVALRKIEAGINIDYISKLDFVLVSHAHMDHMSIGTIDDLDDKFPKAKLIFPLGVEGYLPSNDMDMIRMKTGNADYLNYIGETKEFDGVKITTIYAKHIGGRYGLDSYVWNYPGCTGYIIEYKGYTVLYSGDTAFGDEAYEALGNKFRINLALIPIGPCFDNCYSLGNKNHVATRGALIMFDNLKADYMIPVHYGAIQYRDDPRTPLYVLQEIIEEEPHYKEKIKILNEGEQIVFEKK
jgi:L-ascorbate metabolism protein UlaG (beta-lactamase superfamily)